MIARLSGARRVVGFAREALREPAESDPASQTVSVPSGLHVIRKNLALVEGALGIPAPRDRDGF